MDLTRLMLEFGIEFSSNEYDNEGDPYVWTAEGWLYVAAVVDLFSRRVVGWSMSTAMSAISWQPVELE